MKMLKSIDKHFFVMLVNSTTNILLSVLKIVVGFLFNSQLLIADGIHSASDLLTDIFAMIGLHAAKKPEDEAHPFGHGNLEYASSLTVSVLIFFMTYGLIAELVSNWKIVATDVSIVVLSVSFATFIIKLTLSYYVLYQANKLDSHTLKSSGLESLTDAYSTIIVIIGLLITNFGIKHNITWLIYAEKIATIIIILMLIKTAWTIFFNSIVGIAGAHASEQVQERFFGVIKDYIIKNEQQFELTEFIVLKQGIDYGIYIKISFKKNMPLNEASNIIAHLRTLLSEDARVKKVNIEFNTTFK